MNPPQWIMTRFCQALALGAWCAIASAGDAPERLAGDWPHLLGPGADGISRETGLLDRWPAGGPPVVWSRPLGTGYSAPSVRGAILVAHHRTGAEQVVEAIDAGTGTSIWRHAGAVPSEPGAGGGTGSLAGAAAAGKRLYLRSENRLVCLALAR